MGNPSLSPSSSHSNNHYSSRIRSPTQRSSLFFCDLISVSADEPRCSLDSCFFCKTRLQSGDDIYMYRGNIPFCSEECRQEKIEIDEAQKRRNKIKSSAAAIPSTAKSHAIQARAVTAAVAG